MSAALGTAVADMACLQGAWFSADPQPWRVAGVAGPDGVLVEADGEGLAQAEAKGWRTPEHLAHESGCPAGIHLGPVDQGVAYADACWAEVAYRPRFQAGARIWVSEGSSAPSGWTLVSPLAVLDRALELDVCLDVGPVEIVRRVWKLIYAGEWRGDYPAIGGVTKQQVSEAAAAATAAQPKRATWYDADHLARLAGVSEVLDRRADGRLWDQYGLRLDGGGLVGVHRWERIRAYVVGAGEPDDNQFPIVASIANRDNPESPLAVHDVGPSDDLTALADFVARLAA